MSSEKFNANFYPGTQTLINNFGEKDAARLAVLERAHTAQTSLDARRNPVKGNFDLEHLQEIHKRIFAGIYPWAGEVRDHPMFKGRIDGLTTEFARPNEIAQRNQELKQIMKDTKNFTALKPGEFPTKIAQVYQLTNDMHPFREGNGRTQRIMLDYLAKQAGFKLDFSKIEKDAWNYAASMSGQLHLGTGGDRLPGSMNELNKVFQHVSVPRDQLNSYAQGRNGMDKPGQASVMRLNDLNPKLGQDRKAAYRR